MNTSTLEELHAELELRAQELDLAEWQLRQARNNYNRASNEFHVEMGRINDEQETAVTAL